MAFLGDWTDVPKIDDRYVQGRIEMEPMIIHTLPADRIAEGDVMHEGRSIRTVIVH